MLSVLIFGIQVEVENQGIYRLHLESFATLLSDLVGYISKMKWSLQIITTLLGKHFKIWLISLSGIIKGSDIIMSWKSVVASELLASIKDAVSELRKRPKWLFVMLWTVCDFANNQKFSLRHKLFILETCFHGSL